MRYIVINIIHAPPVNPCKNPDVTLGVTGPQIVEKRRKNKEALDQFTACVNADKALKSQIIVAVDETCIRANRHKCVGCKNVTTKDALDHLCVSYDKITRGDLRDNEVRMNQPFDSSQPIEDAIDFVATGKAVFTTQRIVKTACNLACDTALFSDECKAWRKLEPANQTWA